MPKQKIKLPIKGCVGNLQTQMIDDYFNQTNRKIKIVSGLQEVNIADLFSQVQTATKELEVNKIERLLDLYYVVKNGTLVDVSKQKDFVLANTFVLGVLIGKFLSNTKSIIKIDKSPIKV